MKKVIVLVCVMVFALCLAGCRWRNVTVFRGVNFEILDDWVFIREEDDAASIIINEGDIVMGIFVPESPRTPNLSFFNSLSETFEGILFLMAIEEGFNPRNLHTFEINDARFRYPTLGATFTSRWVDYKGFLIFGDNNTVFIFAAIPGADDGLIDIVYDFVTSIEA